MAKTKTNRRRRHHTRSNRRRHHRRNPGSVSRFNRRHRHRRNYRRNPGGVGRAVDLGMTALFTIIGAVGSKLGTQMLLGSNNVGLMGYAGNAAVGGVLWFVAEKFVHNKAAANGMIAGTAVQIVIRLINDYTPFGQYVSNLGVGDYQAQAFVTPQVLVDPYNSAQIQIPAGWGTGAPAVAAGVSGLGGSVYDGSGNLY